MTSMRRRRAVCGTLGGYRRHLRNGEEPDDACRDALRRYQRGWREQNGTTQQERQKKLRLAALARLADLYPRDYERLYAEVVAEMSDQP